MSLHVSLTVTWCVMQNWWVFDILIKTEDFYSVCILHGSDMK